VTRTCLIVLRNTAENVISSLVLRRYSPFFVFLWCIGLLSLAFGCGGARQPSKPAPSYGQWIEFEGTWTAAGTRSTMRLGGDRRASASVLDGSLVLAGPSRPSAGFRSEAITFGDSATGMVGRAVWTDEKGDQVYSELRGEGTAQNNKITGTFLGGTGRYLGIAGDYEFSWRFVLQNEDGIFQGQSMGLKGRARLQGSGTTADGGRS
jgi:hypothetical protein